MIPLLKRIFLDEWQRKLVSLLASILIFFLINQSLTTTKTFSNISVKIINIAPGKTVDGIAQNGYLSRKISLTITGKKSALEELSSSDLEVVVDATGKTQGFTVSISEKNLFSINPDFNVYKEIRKVAKRDFYVQLVNISSEKIPVYLLKPAGESPKGYQFLDIRPHIVYVEVTGPEDIVKRLKVQGLVKIYNLNEIPSSELDGLSSYSKHQDVVSYKMAEDQCFVHIPNLSPDKKFYFEKAPIIDFLRTSILPIEGPIPLSIFIPTKQNLPLNQEELRFESNEWVSIVKGAPLFRQKIFAKGVSQFFIETVQEWMEIVVVPIFNMGQTPTWSLEFINHRELEERYVAKMLLDSSSQSKFQDQPETVRKEFYRARFRQYMNQILLVQEDGSPLELNIEVKEQRISLRQDKSNYAP